MKTKNKWLIPILSLGLLFTANSEISYADTTDGMDKYYQMIDNGKILPPQYEDKGGKLMTDKIPKPEDWKKEIEKQQYGMGSDNTVLIDRDLNKVTINKKDDEGNPVKGVTFKIYWTQEDMDNNRNPVLEGITNEDGELAFDLSKDLSKNEDFKENFKYYGFYVKETDAPKGYKIAEDEYIYFYKDNGVRFLGEISPKDMKVTSINQNSKEQTLDSNKNVNEELQRLTTAGYDFKSNTNWLVFNDNGIEKLVAKKPLKYDISWNALNSAGLVFGNKTRITINNKTYKIRLMRGFNESTGVNDPNNWDYGKTDYQNHVKGSEWNRLILPLIDPTGDDSNTGYNSGTNGRYGDDTRDFVEKNMPTLANYSWWKDFGGNSNNFGSYSKGSNYGVYRWMQDNRNGSRAFRGENISHGAATDSNSDYPYYSINIMGWLPVLEEVKEKPLKLYAAKGWLNKDGEKAILNSEVEETSDNIGGSNFDEGKDDIGYYTSWKYGENEDIQNNEELKELYKGREVKFYGEIKVDDLEVKDGEGNDIPEDKTLNTYLQDVLTKDVGEKFNEDTNWLVFNDNGTEKLVSKKPLKHSIAWNSLYNAGVVFGEDTTKEKLKDEANFTDSTYNHSNISLKNKDYDKGKGKDKSYEHQYVEINGNKYIVRLMRTYSDDTPINDRTKKFGQYEKTKGSERNRLILPLIGSDKGRSGSNSKKGVENNMPTLANYSWWKDFGGNSDESGKYIKGKNYGVWRWAQETGYDGSRYRAFRGLSSSDIFAAHSGSYFPGDYGGWLPVLERVDNN